MWFLRIVVASLWPAYFAARHVRAAISEAGMLHHPTNRRRWQWDRVSEVVIFVLSEWICVNMVEIDLYWPCLRSLTSMGLAAQVIDAGCHMTVTIFFEEFRLFYMALHIFWACFMVHYWFIEATYIISAFLALWTIILILEDRTQKVGQPPSISSVTPECQVVALLPSINSGFLSWQFRPVKIIDFNLLDESFRPNVSAIFAVEVRRRNLIWRQLIVWQVSLLNGGKKRIKTIDVIDKRTDARPFSRRWDNMWRIEGFQSSGVLLIADWLLEPKLFVHDVRYGGWAEFVLPRQPHRSHVISISCLGRQFNSDRSVRGWKIRVLTHGYTRCENHGGFRSFLRKTVLELQKTARPIGDVQLISDQEIEFGDCHVWGWVINRTVRTSRGEMGVFREVNDDDGPNILYSPSTDTFIHLENFDALIQRDDPLGLYLSTQSPMGEVEVGSGYNHEWFPFVLTSEECIECVREDIVFRTRFTVLPAKYISAETMFRSRPKLRSEMSAEEFRMRTGITGLEAHFDN